LQYFRPPALEQSLYRKKSRGPSSLCFGEGGIHNRFQNFNRKSAGAKARFFLRPLGTTKVVP
jgi:hypothetical protein